MTEQKRIRTRNTALSACPQGGVKSFLHCLREHAPLVRSADDANTYLVNDTADPLQRSLW